MSEYIFKGLTGDGRLLGLDEDNHLVLKFGAIFFNSNNGVISNNQNAVGIISYNTNNGSIDNSAIVGDINDPVVDK